MPFLNDETGAVTVDWVVLTAALVGLGLATMGVVSGGVENVSNDVAGEMTSQTIFTTFSQRNHPGLYEAYLAFSNATTNPSWQGAGASKFQQFIDDMNSYDDPTVVMFESMLATNVGDNTAKIAAIDAAGDLEALSYAQMSAINGVPEATIQANVEGGYGSKTAYLEAIRSSAVLANLQYEAYAAEKAARGL